MKKRLGAAIVPVLIILWTILNLANPGTSTSDEDSYHVSFGAFTPAVDAFLSIVGLVAIGAILYGAVYCACDLWKSWRTRKSYSPG